MNKQNPINDSAAQLCGAEPTDLKQAELQYRRQLWDDALKAIDFHNHPEKMTLAQLTEIDDL